MTEAFERLLNELNASGPVSTDALIDALSIVRAHRTLTGTIPAVRTFLDLSTRYPELLQAPETLDWSAGLEVLERIAKIDTDDANLSGYILKHKVEEDITPLRPLTGDSGICDLLLMRAKGTIEQQLQHQELTAWYIWQVQRLHAGYVTRVEYKKYLLDNKPKAENADNRLLKTAHGSRVYQAFLAVRKKSDSKDVEPERLSRLTKLGLGMSLERSVELTLLARLAQLESSRSIRKLTQYAKEELGFVEQTLRAAVYDIDGAMPSALVLLLITNWLPELTRRTSNRTRRRKKDRKNFRPDVTRSKFLTEIIDRVDENGVHAGTVIDLHFNSEPNKEEIEDKYEEDDDPDEQEYAEADVTLFLGESEDLLRGYYAAKGRQTAIEYANALLPWSKWTLSRVAVDAVLGLVRLVESENKPHEETERRARLAIGLCLVSGRSLSEVANPLFAAGLPEISKDHPVGISVDNHLLVVRAGRPKLKSEASMTEFCHKTTQYIRLPLPPDWQPLIQSLGIRRPARGAGILALAREFLRTLDPHLQVTGTGLRLALGKELAQVTRGDLGMLKIVTDGSDANLQNIGHYISCSVAQIESCWREAAEALVGPLPDISSSRDHVWAGARHAFDIDKLAVLVESIKTRISDAKREDDSIKAFNLHTLYLSYWLGLATAGRKSRKPVPRIFLAGNWVLVMDKSRGDSSTDRVLPLTEGLLAQLDSYFTHASELSLSAPDLDPLIFTEFGYQIQLQYLRRDGSVAPYRPKYQEKHHDITPLPANWGRKFARSESGALRGRYRDAGLGHWAQGRNPWRQTSTLDSQNFSQRWLDLQHGLEPTLGFTPIYIYDGDPTSRPVPRLAMPPKALKEKQPSTSTPQVDDYSAAQLNAMLKRVSNEQYRDVFEDDNPFPNLALDLVRRTLKKNLPKDETERISMACALCDHVRKETKIPLYAMRPRPLYAGKITLDTSALLTLAYVEEHVLPQFYDELANMHSPEIDKEGAPIELGRFLMIVIWRLGLTRWPLLDAFLKRISRGAPVLATHNTRYLILTVPSQHTNEPMRRTVILDDYSASYLLAERQRLHPVLEYFYTLNQQRRRGQAERAINTYLTAIGCAKKRISLSAMTDAAVQSIMLSTSPLVASYSAGQFYTHDLDDTDLRRLAGLMPKRTGVNDQDLGRDIRDDQITTDTESIPVDVDQECDSQALALIKGAVGLTKLRAQLLDYRPETAVDRLLRGFVVWQLDALLASGENKLTPRKRNHMINRITIVAHALQGFSAVTARWNTIDEASLESLAELSADHFPTRAHNGAWHWFHLFLRDKNADHAGFKIERLGLMRDHMVSAKILSQAECDQIRSILPSVRSGIGNPNFRLSASRLFDLIVTYGFRRSEAEHLRCIDTQVNMARVQPYGNHGLKTAWAERAVPLDYAPIEIRQWIDEVVLNGQKCLVDPGRDTDADGSNYFNAMNRLIKHVTQDEDLGSHHLRHTVASSLTLSLLAKPTEIVEILDDFPWIEGHLVDQRRLTALLGSEGDGGQGLQAVSAMLGHSHPTTTARHYIHGMCVALHAGLRKTDTLDSSRSFERRIASRATVQRWAKAARESAPADVSDDQKRQIINRYLRDQVEKFVGEGVHVDETPLSKPTVIDPPIEPSGGAGQRQISFDILEAIDRSLRDGEKLVDDDILKRAACRMKQLGAINSGKIGSDLPRHPLVQCSNGVLLPARLAAHKATDVAVAMCDWLEWLRLHHIDDFHWVLDKWINSSQAKRGYMRLDGQGEWDRAQAISAINGVCIDLSKHSTTASRQATNSNATLLMRIRRLSDNGKFTNRGTEAIRWVMTYVSAMHSPLFADSVSD